MKLITLISTFIITLVSSNVFAQTFLCDNWVDSKKEEIQGTLFLGEKVGDNFIIKDFLKDKRTLTYIGKNVYEDSYYTSDGRNGLQIYIIGTKTLSTIKWSKDGNSVVGKYDLIISELRIFGISKQTFCNYQ